MYASIIICLSHVLYINSLPQGYNVSYGTCKKAHSVKLVYFAVENAKLMCICSLLLVLCILCRRVNRKIALCGRSARYFGVSLANLAPIAQSMNALKTTDK